MAAKEVKFSGDARDRMLRGVDTFDHDAVMQRTKFGFSHDSSFWRLRFQVWFRSGVPSEVDGNTGTSDTAKGPNSPHP